MPRVQNISNRVCARELHQMKNILIAVLLSCLPFTVFADEAPLYSAIAIDHQCDRMKATAINVLASRGRGTSLEQALMLNGGSKELDAIIDKAYAISLPKSKAEREAAAEELAQETYNDCQQAMVGRLQVEDESKVVKQ
jgi:hypothetical protein